MQQDIPNLLAKIDNAAQCNENSILSFSVFVFFFLFQLASNIERDQIAPGGS